MGQFRRKRISLLVAAALLSLLYWLFSTQIRQWSSQAVFTNNEFLHSDLRVRKDLYYPNYQFRETAGFAETFGRNWDTFDKKSLHDKCLSFFQYMKKAQPEWQFDAASRDGHDKDVARKHNYVRRKFKVLKKQKDKANEGIGDEITDSDRAVLNEWLDTLLGATRSAENAMADDTTVLRLFSHCFLGPESEELVNSPELQPLYRWWSPRVSPILLDTFPLFERTDGTVYHNSFGPESATFNPESGLLDHYRRHISGSGIVISGSTRFVRPIIKLIRLFRVMGNTLPIQIVFRGDILLRAKRVLYAVAEQSKEEMLDPAYSDSKLLEKLYPGFNLDHDTIKELEYPPQDLTLVNIDRSIHASRKGSITGFNNKILALFFSSFQNVLLYDADTVPLVSPQEILDAPEFAASGAYFFQDRSLRDRNDWMETNLFAKLMPHSSNKLDMAMGVKPVTNHTMGNPYMVGWRHYQEAGLLAIDKRRHFGMLPTLFALPLWGEIVRALIWGDKEMYWLAMSMSGDELYYMNHYGAASVGEITQHNHLKAYNNTEAYELCSSHPGHINKDGKLLWVNSGFSYCKKNSFAKDSKKFPFSRFAQPSVGDELYKRPLTISHAIVPPALPMLRLPGGSPDLLRELEFDRLFTKRKKDVDELDVDQISLYSPQKGWVKSSTCSNYQYCAYDAIESYLKPNTLDKSGTIFTFLPQETQKFNFYGAMWLSGNRPVKVKEPPKPEAEEAPKSEPINNAPPQPLNPDAKVAPESVPKWRDRPEKFKNNIADAIDQLLLKQQKQETPKQA